jgi:hypothetical protein
MFATCSDQSWMMVPVVAAVVVVDPMMWSSGVQWRPTILLVLVLLLM